jgi:hypothetical protein
MVDQSLIEQAREAILRAIVKAAPDVGNSPAGIRELAEAYALLERDLIPQRWRGAEQDLRIVSCASSRW